MKIVIANSSNLIFGNKNGAGNLRVSLSLALSLSFFLSLSLSLSLFLSLPLSLSFYLSFSRLLSLRLSLSLSLSVSIYLSASISFSLSLYFSLSLRLSLYLSISPSRHMLITSKKFTIHRINPVLAGTSGSCKSKLIGMPPQDGDGLTLRVTPILAYFKKIKPSFLII